jgi:hypothetical protein
MPVVSLLRPVSDSIVRLLFFARLCGGELIARHRAEESSSTHIF